MSPTFPHRPSSRDRLYFHPANARTLWQPRRRCSIWRRYRHQERERRGCTFRDSRTNAFVGSRRRQSQGGRSREQPLLLDWRARLGHRWNSCWMDTAVSWLRSVPDSNEHVAGGGTVHINGPSHLISARQAKTAHSGRGHMGARHEAPQGISRLYSIDIAVTTRNALADDAGSSLPLECIMFAPDYPTSRKRNWASAGARARPRPPGGGKAKLCGTKNSGPLGSGYLR